MLVTYIREKRRETSSDYQSVSLSIFTPSHLSKTRKINHLFYYLLHFFSVINFEFFYYINRILETNRIQFSLAITHHSIELDSLRKNIEGIPLI